MSEQTLTRKKVEKFIRLLSPLHDRKTSVRIAREYLKALDCLKAIREHQEIIGGTLGKHGTTWKMANDFLKGRE